MKRHAKKSLNTFQALEDKMLTLVIGGDPTDPPGSAGNNKNGGDPPPEV